MSSRCCHAQRPVTTDHSPPPVRHAIAVNHRSQPSQITLIRAAQPFDRHHCQLLLLIRPSVHGRASPRAPCAMPAPHGPAITSSGLICGTCDVPLPPATRRLVRCVINPGPKGDNYRTTRHIKSASAKRENKGPCGSLIHCATYLVLLSVAAPSRLGCPGF